MREPRQTPREKGEGAFVLPGLKNIDRRFFRERSAALLSAETSTFTLK
jgi:hypothetical protein